MKIFYTLLLIAVTLSVRSQVTDKTIKGFIESYKSTGFKLYKTVKPKEHSYQLPYRLGCLSGKEVLLVGFFESEPVELDGRFIIYHISKKNGVIKRRPDVFDFQKASYNENLKTHYALLQLQIPKEANQKNCDANVVLYDKKNKKKSAHLLIFTK